MRANSRFKNIIKSDRPVVVDFYADWCQPCKEIQPVLIELKNEFKQDIRVLKVNVDFNPYIANQFQVKSIPTVMIFKSGDLQWSKEGLVLLPELTDILKKYISAS
ncbi:thioredoxin [Mangrovibacterium diazotrophicum]|uniref:Thioredoxin n=1 Tax=Mangrovibacterium diazotrophicum TaxID=1261403 RepID=A0A419VWI5_9BACT|nr:thioredoxin [Mangrovibacterium diazotrophicum]RKD86513.1 thioredoxin [Mangrovibacterium diazotrophicum]